MAFVIVTGPDGTGKTDFVSYMSKSLGVDSVKFTRHSRYSDYISRLAAKGPINEVWDRTFHDEYVYQPVKRPGRSQIFGLKEWDNLALLAYARCPTLVFCSNILREEDDYVTPEENREILQGYRKLVDHLSAAMPVVEYRAGIDNPDIVMGQIAANAGPPDWWTDMWSSGYGGIGSVRPKIVLLAEVLGPYNHNRLPFEAGPSGHFLSEILHKAQVRLSDIYITNTVKTGDADTDMHLLELEIEGLAPKLGVVMLGSVARDTAGPVLDKLGVPNAHLIHPSAWCRFHKKELSEYPLMLRARLKALGYY